MNHRRAHIQARDGHNRRGSACRNSHRRGYARNRRVVGSTDNVTAFGDANASAGITFSVDPFWIVCAVGPERTAETLTIWLVPVNPNAVALTAALPKETPATRGKPIGAVEPAGMYTFCGVTVSLELSLLESVTVMPPGGAASVRKTESGTESPGATFKPADNVISAASAAQDTAENRRRAVQGGAHNWSPKIDPLGAAGGFPVA